MPWWLFIVDLTESQATLTQMSWLTHDNYDLSYQWPTTAARDPVSGQIAAFGFRLEFFTLDDGGDPTFLDPKPWMHHQGTS